MSSPVAPPPSPEIEPQAMLTEDESMARQKINEVEEVFKEVEAKLNEPGPNVHQHYIDALNQLDKKACELYEPENPYTKYTAAYAYDLYVKLQKLYEQHAVPLKSVHCLHVLAFLGYNKLGRYEDSRQHSLLALSKAEVLPDSVDIRVKNAKLFLSHRGIYTAHVSMNYPTYKSIPHLEECVRIMSLPNSIILTRASLPIWNYYVSLLVQDRKYLEAYSILGNAIMFCHTERRKPEAPLDLITSYMVRFLHTGFFCGFAYFVGQNPNDIPSLHVIYSRCVTYPEFHLNPLHRQLYMTYIEGKADQFKALSFNKKFSAEAAQCICLIYDSLVVREKFLYNQMKD